MTVEVDSKLFIEDHDTRYNGHFLRISPDGSCLYFRNGLHKKFFADDLLFMLEDATKDEDMINLILNALSTESE